MIKLEAKCLSENRVGEGHLCRSSIKYQSLHTVLPACSQAYKSIHTMAAAHRTVLVATSCPNYLLCVNDVMLT